MDTDGDSLGDNLDPDADNDGILDDNEKKKIYHLSNGTNSSRNIAEQVSVSRSTIQKYWNTWSNFNIVEPIPVKGGGLRYKKMFNLEDFGIEIPTLKSLKAEVK